MNYYDRSVTTFVDGTPIFKTAADEASEETVSEIVSAAWNCALHSFGRLAPIDWYAVRDGRLVALLELKTRSHDSLKYPTVFLNLRKWLALMLGSVGMGVPAIFVVRFADGVRWIRLSDVEPSGAQIGGCVKIVKSRSDIEPVIHVPVSAMQTFAENAA